MTKNEVLKSIPVIFFYRGLLLSLVGISLAHADWEAPLHSQKQWQVLTFSRLPPNRVTFDKTGLLVEVEKSSSPLIYPLPKPLKVSSFFAKGQVLEGQLHIPESEQQGSQKADDFIFKLGLVQKGKQTLNWLQRHVAASWVIKLFDLAPRGTGIKNILFFNVVENFKDMGIQRTHPLSDLIQEEYISTLHSQTQKFVLEKTLDSPIEILALWLSFDGDETQSSYKVRIEQIVLNPQKAPLPVSQ